MASNDTLIQRRFEKLFKLSTALRKWQAQYIRYRSAFAYDNLKKTEKEIDKFHKLINKELASGQIKIFTNE